LEDYFDKKTLNDNFVISGKKKSYVDPSGVFSYLKNKGISDIYYSNDSNKKFTATYDVSNKDFDTVASDVEQIVNLLHLYKSETGKDTSKYVELFSGWLSDYSAASESMAERAKQVDEFSVKEAILRSDVYMWDAIDINNASLEEAIDEVADYLHDAGVQVRNYSGEITSEARKLIVNALKEDDRYAPLMKTKTLTVSDMLVDVKLLNEYLSELGINYDQLLEVFKHESAENLQLQEEYADKLGISVDKLRNVVYKTNPETL
jgi:hypothetical protein